MGLFGSSSKSSDQVQSTGSNGNVRDGSNPDGARHAAVEGEHVKAVRLGTQDYKPRHAK